MNKNLIDVTFAFLAMQALNVNTIAAKMKNLISRSEVFKKYHAFKSAPKQKAIIVKKSNVAGIYDIVDNSAGLAYQHTSKVIHTCATVTNLTRAAKFHGFKVAVL
jgi:hypothetical protein